MRTIKNLTDNKYLNLKEIVDTEHHVNGFQFAERKGIDSIAFICFDRDREQFLLNKEYKPPIDAFILGAFGGSMDKNKRPEEIVLDEVREEAGFIVKPDDVKLVGKVLVSTQMNQFCYLYVVFVDKDNQQEKHPENAVEALATTHWILWGAKELDELQDWKPITIITLAHDKDII